MSARKAGSRVAFGAAKMRVGRTSKNIEKPWEYARFRHFEGSDLKVFVTFPLVLMHFVSDGKFRFRRAFGVIKKGCTAVFKKHYKTCEILIISSF